MAIRNKGLITTTGNQKNNAKSTSNSGKNRNKYVQSRLQFGSSKNNIAKCTKCDMTYSPNIIEDEIAHKKFHDLRIKGRKWSPNWGVKVPVSILDENIQSTNKFLTPSLSQDSMKSNERIVMIRPDHIKEVKATLEIMTLVNNELSAPHDENDIWSSSDSSTGKAFVYVKDDRAIGIITIELLNGDRSRWMVYKTKGIVQNSKPKFILGISRIWVCRSHRLSGIATKLLNAARQNTIMGKIIDKHFMAWSQPSESGGKLAKRYNGIRHASGEILIPCYI